MNLRSKMQKRGDAFLSEHSWICDHHHGGYAYFRCQWCAADYGVPQDRLDQFDYVGNMPKAGCPGADVVEQAKFWSMAAR